MDPVTKHHLLETMLEYHQEEKSATLANEKFEKKYRLSQCCILFSMMTIQATALSASFQ